MPSSPERKDWADPFRRKVLPETDPDALWIQEISKRLGNDEEALRNHFAKHEAELLKMRELEERWKGNLKGYANKDAELTRGGYHVLGDDRKENRLERAQVESRLGWLRQTSELRENIYNEKYRRWGDYGDPRDWETISDPDFLGQKLYRHCYDAKKRNPDNQIPHIEEIGKLIEKLERDWPEIIPGAISNLEKTRKEAERLIARLSAEDDPTEDILRRLNELRARIDTVGTCTILLTSLLPRE